MHIQKPNRAYSTHTTTNTLAEVVLFSEKNDPSATTSSTENANTGTTTGGSQNDPSKDTNARIRKIVGVSALILVSWFANFALRQSTKKEGARKPVPEAKAEGPERTVLMTTKEDVLKRLGEGGDLQKVAFAHLEYGLIRYEFPLSSNHEASVNTGWIKHGHDSDEFTKELEQLGVQLKPGSERFIEIDLAAERREAERAQERLKDMQTLENTYLLEKVFALALVGVTMGLLLRRAADKMKSAGALSGIPGFGETTGEEMQMRPVEGFDHVGGIEQVIEELTYLRDEIREVGQGSQEYEIPKGLLFYGPPGTGKTMLARALAAETRCPFISFKGSDLSTELYIGTGIRKVRNAFERARKQRDGHTKELQAQGVLNPRGVCIVFIDEFDSIASRRRVAMGEASSEETRVVNMLLTELDNIHKSDKSRLSNRDILVIAATNDLANLDPAVIRNGRFNRKIEIPAPNSKLTRLDILDKATKYGFEPKGWTIEDRNTSLDRLARMAVGSSGADLVGVLDKAQAISRRRGNDKIITFADIMEGFQQQNFGFKMSSIINAAERRKTAYHELVGHGATAWACEIATFLISMEPRGKSLGRVIPDPEAMSELAPTKKQLLQRILVSVAGQVAEELRYGELGATVGNTGDLDSSRDILRLLISTGLVGDDVAVSLLEARGRGNKMINDNQQRLINKAISRAKDTVEAILSAVSNDQWDAIVDELLALDKELVGDEAQAFLEKHLGGREDLRETARRALEGYYQDPIGENQTDR